MLQVVIVCTVPVFFITFTGSTYPYHEDREPEQTCKYFCTLCEPEEVVSKLHYCCSPEDVLTDGIKWRYCNCDYCEDYEKEIILFENYSLDKKHLCFSCEYDREENLREKYLERKYVDIWLRNLKKTRK